MRKAGIIAAGPTAHKYMMPNAALPPPTLSDGELCLRPWREDEASVLVDLLQASMDSVGRWMSWCTPAYSSEDALRWLGEVERSWVTGEGECALAITQGHGGPPLGCIGVNQFRYSDRMANLGYWVGQPYQGQHLAARAARLLRPFAFKRFGLQRLEVVVAESNHASRRTAEQAGACFEGIARRRLMVHDQSLDAAMYALVATDGGSARTSRERGR
jgi:RimJ/RimL family protein N-acetyltransferase